MADHEALPDPKPGEHPFAPYVRILGRGRRGSRSLSRAEAEKAMGMILAGEVESVQLGAFLMLIRVKEETADELAGFVSAARGAIDAPDDLPVDLDWSSYAGKRRHAPWFLLALQLLADAGWRIFIHGAEGHTPERLYTRAVMKALGLGVAGDWAQVRTLLDSQGLCYFPLDRMLPSLSQLIDLRPILGLRSPVHSLARLLNPLNAPCVFQGIFHPPYAPLHQQAALALDYQRVAVIKGEGGEIERNPDGKLRVFKARRSGDEPLAEEEWPAMFERRHVRPEEIGVEPMRAVWRGDTEDEYATAAIVGTAALALRELMPELDQARAMARALTLWYQRDRSRF